MNFFSLFSQKPNINMDKLVSLVKLHEGKKLFPYTDTTGHITIGYGTNLNAGITDDEASYLLSNRLQLSLRACQAQSWWAYVSDNDARSRAIVDLVFNLGIGGFTNFTKFITCLYRRDYADAAKELLNSKAAEQTGYRYKTLAYMIEHGSDQL